MIRTNRISLSVLLALAMTLSIASVRTFAEEKAKAAGDLASKDKKFVEEAAMAGMTEVKAGEAASQKGENTAVKEFGAMMVKDHTAANDELKAFASSHNVTIPANLDEKHQKQVDKLSS